MTVISNEPIAPGRRTCKRHPDKVTGLSCNSCGDPICPKCAQKHVIGYRCPKCKSRGKEIFYNGKRQDLLIAICTALPLSLLVAFAFTFLPVPWFLALLAAPPVTRFIAEAVRYTVRKRRSPYLAHLVAGCLVVATLACLVALAVITLPYGGVDFLEAGYALITPGILVATGVTTIVARLR